MLRSPEASCAEKKDAKLLPGSFLSFEEATRRAHVIVVAKVVDMGGAEPRVGIDRYNSAKLHVVKVLRGQAQGDLLARIEVWWYHPNLEKKGPMVKEIELKGGRKYLFFIDKSDGKRVEVIKVLPASDVPRITHEGIVKRRTVGGDQSQEERRSLCQSGV